MALVNWYDYPAYFDLAFRDETAEEAKFLVAAFAKYVAFPVRRVLEPACGTGRLIAALAAKGFSPVGFDLSEPMLAYARKRETFGSVDALYSSGAIGPKGSCCGMRPWCSSPSSWPGSEHISPGHDSARTSQREDRSPSCEFARPAEGAGRNRPQARHEIRG